MRIKRIHSNEDLTTQMERVYRKNSASMCGEDFVPNHHRHHLHSASVLHHISVDMIHHNHQNKVSHHAHIDLDRANVDLDEDTDYVEAMSEDVVASPGPRILKEIISPFLVPYRNSFLSDHIAQQ